MRDNADQWHGAELSLVIAGHWQYYRAKVMPLRMHPAVINDTDVRPVARQPVASRCRDQQLYLALTTSADVANSTPQVLKYLRQIAVITPYAQFRFRYTAQDERNSVAVTFVRRTLKMPVPPVVRTSS